MGVDVRMRLKQSAESDAVDVFAANLRDLLLAAPAGTRPTMGLDPGFRTGTKVAVVDATGKVVDHTTIYPHQPHNKHDQSLATLAALVVKHGVELIAIGNGTASRETDALAAELIAKSGVTNVTKIVVSEAGASVYSRPPMHPRNFPTSTCRSAVRSRSRGACRIRSPSWSRSTPSRSVSASTSTTCPRRCWRGRSVRSSKMR